jgi:PAS domain S-box-containing protein
MSDPHADDTAIRPARGGRGSLTLLVGGGALVAAAVAALLVTLVLGAIDSLHRSSIQATRTAQALAALERVQKDALDLETGLRGYVITAQPRFLDPYRSARAAIPLDTARLLRLLAADRVQLQRAQTLTAAVNAYLGEYAEPLIKLIPRRPAAARTQAVTQAGRLRFDALRRQVDAILGAESAGVNSRTLAAQRSARHASDEGYVVLGLLLALVAALALALQRLVVTPLRRAARAVETLADGDLSARAPETGRAEVGRLARSVNRLAESLRQSRTELEQRNAELAAIAERNLVLLDAVFEQTPVALAFVDPQLRFVRVNQALAAITGRPLEEHVGRPLAEANSDLLSAIGALVAQVVRSGKPIRQHEHVVEHPQLRAWLIDAYPVRQGDKLLGAGVELADISERWRIRAERELLHEAEREARRASERARRRADFLAEASAVLDASLDLEETLAAFSYLAVPEIADWCAVELLDDDGRLQTVTVAHVDPEKVALARELQERYPADPHSPTGAPNVVRTGRSVLYETIPDELLRQAAVDEEHYRVSVELGMTSAMMVPMTARGRALGVITFVAAGAERRFGTEDLLEAEELGRRAALAVDTARLYTASAETARVLQMSLLPQRLPLVEGFELATRFHAAGEGSLVGGDFYDVFRTGPDTWAIVIGDVCGKGPEAAAVTALARYTLRALASEPLTPVQALNGLNAAMLRQQTDQRFVTMVYAVLDLRGQRPRLSVACAGHPPPLFARAGEPPRPLRAAGTLLGVMPNVTFEVAELELEGGDALVCYSDGVTEADRPRVLSPAQLASDVGVQDTAEHLATAVEQAAFRNSGGLRDDVAILALRFSPGVSADAEAAVWGDLGLAADDVRR